MRAAKYLFFTAIFLAACHAQRGKVGPHAVGSTDFVSQPPGGGGARTAGGADGAPGAGGTAGSPAPGGTQSGGTNATTTGGNRAIEEADIYKVVGNTLYALNAYRGLQILDLTDLGAPKLLARVPIIGNPVDLYVRNGTAYVVVSDFFYYYGGVEAGGAAGDAAGCATTPWLGSTVVAVDVTQPAQPQVLGTLQVDGEVTESRIVGNVLYVLSRAYAWWFGPGPSNGTSQDQAYVASFDISNPAAMAKVQEVDFPGQGWDTHANITTSLIFVAQSGWDQSGEVTNYQAIDISDPKGAMALGASFSTDGYIRDRWTMDYDAQTGLFRAVAMKDWENSGATLHDFAVASPSNITEVGHLDVAAGETLTAARFDGSRVYAVSAVVTDPLWVLDTTDPVHPALLGQLQMPGELDFVEPRGSRLVALGHTNEAGQPWQLQVSLLDVSNAAQPSLLSRVVFGSSWSWVSAKADDMRKAFQVLDSLGLILVPLQGWDETNYRYAGGTQLIDYSPSALTLRGFLSHAGSITRSFPITQDKIVALSDESLQIIDASNRDAPTEMSSLELARPVESLAIVNGAAVELSGDWYRGATQLAITDKTRPEDPSPLARIDVAAPYARMFQDGNITWLLARDWQGNGQAWLQAVDVSDPAHPVLRGRLDLDPNQVGYFYGGWWWGYGDEAALVGHALALHRSYYWWCDSYGSCGQQAPDQVFAIDLSDPDHPAVASTVTLPGSDWSWGLQVKGNYAWITHYEWLPNSNWSQVRYFLDRIDFSNPAQPKLVAKINVPGVFFHASDDGQTIYVQEVAWSQNWQNPTTWLDELTLLPNGKARLEAATSVAGYPGGAAIANGHAYLQTWDWSNGTSQTGLDAVDLASMSVTSSQPVTSQWAWLMKAAGGKLFLSAGWYDQGIVTYDLTDADQPSFDRFVRTEGWVMDVVADGQTAYLPSGYYGVPTIDLSSPVSIAQVDRP